MTIEYFYNPPGRLDWHKRRLSAIDGNGKSIHSQIILPTKESVSRKPVKRIRNVRINLSLVFLYGLKCSKQYVHPVGLAVIR